MNIQFGFRARKEEVPPLRTAVGKLLEQEGLESKRVQRAISIVDEVCNNAVEHGSKTDSKIQLKIYVANGQIQITCEDEGGGSTLKAKDLLKIIKSPGSSEISTSIRGRGLSKIVKGFSDSVEIVDLKKGGIRITSTL